MTKEELKYYKEDLKSYDFFHKNHEEDQEQSFNDWIDNFILSES